MIIGQPSRDLVLTDGGAPTEGTFGQGCRAIDATNGREYICTVAGQPGTWVHVGGVRANAAMYGEAFSAGGEAALQRRLVTSASQALISGTVYLTYFYASRTETITRVRSGAGTAQATPTLCRTGVYSVDSSGNLTLAAAHANDTTIWATNNTSYTKTLTASLSKVVDQLYAFASLFVGTTPPALAGLNVANSNAISADMIALPANAGLVSGQTDLPASIAVGSVAFSNKIIYGALLP